MATQQPQNSAKKLCKKHADIIDRALKKKQSPHTIAVKTGSQPGTVRRILRENKVPVESGRVGRVPGAFANLPVPSKKEISRHVRAKRKLQQLFGYKHNWNCGKCRQVMRSKFPRLTSIRAFLPVAMDNTMPVCSECYKDVQKNNKATREKKVTLYSFNYGTLIDSVQAGEIDRMYREMEEAERLEPLSPRFSLATPAPSQTGPPWLRLPVSRPTQLWRVYLAERTAFCP